MSLGNSPNWMYSSGGGFYGTEIDGSLRFNDDDSAYLSRTPSSNTNRDLFTISFWAKRGNLSSSNNYTLFQQRLNSNSSQQFVIAFREDFIRVLDQNDSGTNKLLYDTTPLFRDPSSWYHIVVSVNTSLATAADRAKLYVNGERVTAFSSQTNYSQNYDTAVNTTDRILIGATRPNSSSTLKDYFDGYLAEFNLIDGSALDPTSFGEYKSGVWIPKAYSGSYGTNGFHLDFAGNANDSSGNGNNFTASNISSYDYVPDSPTNNFSTLNVLTKLSSQISLSQGNLKADATSGGSNWGTVFSTIPVPASGKYYIECLAQVQAGSGNRGGIGVIDSSQFNPTASSIVWNQTSGEGFDGIDMQLFDNIFYSVSDGVLTNRASGLTGSAYILMLAIDVDNGKVFTGYNGTWVNSGNPAAGTGQTATRNFSSTDVVAAHTAFGGSNYQRSHVNFGQDSTFAGYTSAGSNSDANGYGEFKYSVPSGYLALCTANLTVAEGVDPAEDNTPQDYFNTVLYTSPSPNADLAVTGVGFQPDFLWIKSRSAGGSNHNVHDVVRGATKRLYPNTTNSEATSGVLSFDADGFTVKNGIGDVNQDTRTYVAWNWKANGSGVSNTDGSITSTVSASTDAGFSIVKYSGGGGAQTVGHGLDVAPRIVFYKSLATSDWNVYSFFIGANQRLQLNKTNSANATSGFNNTHPTSSVLSVNSNTGAVLNNTGNIAYCFHDVDGFSKFGSYTGNGSSEGPFVYTGMRPAYVLIKRTNGGNAWIIFDAVRNTYNLIDKELYANTGEAEDTVGRIDFTSNGFKIRQTGLVVNASGGTYIYMAFAENPFKYANAR